MLFISAKSLILKTSFIQSVLKIVYVLMYQYIQIRGWVKLDFADMIKMCLKEINRLLLDTSKIYILNMLNIVLVFPFCDGVAQREALLQPSTTSFNFNTKE